MDGTIHDSGALAGFPTGLSFNFATGMTSTGQVIGYFAESGPWHAWTWRDGTLLQLGPFDAKVFSKGVQQGFGN